MKTLLLLWLVAGCVTTAVWFHNARSFSDMGLLFFIGFPFALVAWFGIGIYRVVRKRSNWRTRPWPRS